MFNVPFTVRRRLQTACCAVAPLLLAFVPSLVTAADPEFVGVLAMVVDERMADRLELTAEQREALLGLIDRRENDVLDLALKLRDLPADERAAQLAPFRTESERQGLRLLDEWQRARFEGLRAERIGLASLAEPALADRLELTADQRDQVAEIVARRADALGGTAGSSGRVTRAAYERELSAILTEEQLAAWDDFVRGDVVRDDAVASLSSAGAAAAVVETRNVDPQAVAPSIVDAAAARPAVVSPSVVTPPATSSPPAEASEIAVAQSPSDDARGGRDEAASTSPAGERKLRFNFRFAPWEDVLDWFAEEANLSLTADFVPPGTFNYYTDPNFYTPEEALDLINRYLLIKGYSLLRTGRGLVLINLEDVIPPNLVPTVPLDELDKRGEYELISVLFSLKNITAEQAANEIQGLIGPQGKIIQLPSARQISVQETAGHLRAIREVLERIESPAGSDSTGKVFVLKSADPQSAATMIRQLLGIGEEESATEDGSLRFSVDETSGRIIFIGSEAQLTKAEEIMAMVDPEPAPGAAPSAAALEQPQFETYPIRMADPNTVLSVIQTMLAGLPEVRVSVDPLTNRLMVMARPSEHAIVKATLAQLEQDGDKIEVIQLAPGADPQLAVLAISSMFGAADGTAGPGAPKVDAQPLTGQLLVRGSEPQIAEIKGLLAKLNLVQTAEQAATPKSNVRYFQLPSRSQQATLDALQFMWPTFHPGNKIRVMNAPNRATPEDAVREVEPSANDAEQTPAADATSPTTSAKPAPAADGTTPPAPASSPAPRRPRPRSDVTTSNQTHASPFRFVQQTTVPQPQPSPQPQPPAGHEAAPIVIVPTPNGFTYTSEDTEALDAFEEMLYSITGTQGVGALGPHYTVFHIRNAKASAVAATLDTILGGGTLSGTATSGGSLLGDLTTQALGATGGGMMNALLGLGGGSSIVPSGTIQIVPEDRLNALIVQANDNDLDTIEQLLEILDQEEVPDNQVTSRPRLIYVEYSSATEVAEVVKAVYSTRLEGNNGGRGGGQPSPEDFIRALRGDGGGGRGGNSSSRAPEPTKMSVGVDPRLNALVVSAPEPLFREVEELVASLDTYQENASEVTRVVTLKRTNAEAVKDAVAALVGESTKPSAASANGSNNNNSGGPQGGSDAARAAFLQRLQQNGGFGGRGPGGGGPTRFGGGTGGGPTRTRGGGGGPGGFGGFGGGGGGPTRFGGGTGGGRGGGGGGGDRPGGR